jgi:D-3-phosphoglycerate dehydrogenase
LRRSLLEPYNAKVFTNTVKGIGQLSVRLRDADVLVLIRERTHFPRQLLEKLPKLKLIAQTGRVGAHIDLSTPARAWASRWPRASGSPVAPAELTWALIMASDAPPAAVHRQPQARRLAAKRAEGRVDAAELRPRHGAGAASTLGIWGYGKIGQPGGRLRQGVRHAGAGLGQRGLAQARPGRRLRRRREEAFFETSDVLSPAPAPERPHARHRDGWTTCRA